MHQSIFTLVKTLLTAPGIPPRHPTGPVEKWPEAITGDVARVMPALQELLFKEARSGPRVHAETVMSDLGALAGYACQHAIRERLVKTGILPLDAGEDGDSGAFTIVTTGETVHFCGLLLDEYLGPHHEVLPHGPGEDNTLYALLAVAVEAKGGTPVDEDVLVAITRRNAKRTDTNKFGVPSLPRRNQPHHLPREALYRLWPEIVLLLGQRPLYGPGKAIDPAYWPMILGTLAQQLIPQMTIVLDPSLAMRVFFEAAIPMSWVDIDSVLGERP